MKLPTMMRLLKKVSLMLLTALVTVLIVEFLVRQFSPIYYPIIPASFEYDQELAARLKPGAHMFQTTDFQQESQTNRLGTSNFQESFDDYESLIFTVGDSYTKGVGVPADMSYPSQLDLILNQDEQGFYIKKFGVVNLGVSGYGGEQELRSLQRWSAQLRPPSIILYLGCDNDFGDDLLFKSGYRHQTIIAGSPVWGRMTTPLRMLLEQSQIAIKKRKALLRRKLGQVSNEALKGVDKTTSVAELELSVLDRLASYAREHRSLLIVSWSDENESYYWLKSCANQNGIAFADWASKANSVRAAIPALPLDNQHSTGHHRGWTNYTIASEFARQIRASRR